MTRVLSLAAILLASSGMSAIAAPKAYVLDASHSQIVFSYNHLGFSTTYGMFSGFDGEIMFDDEAPADSSVSVSFPVRSMMTGWEQRFGHWAGFDATATVLRSDFNVGNFAPFISDEVAIQISIEAMAAE